LLSYGVILENQIYYNRKVEYISLVEEYLRENAGEDGAITIQGEVEDLLPEELPENRQQYLTYMLSR